MTITPPPFLCGRSAGPFFTPSPFSLWSALTIEKRGGITPPFSLWPRPENVFVAFSRWFPYVWRLVKVDAYSPAYFHSAGFGKNQSFVESERTHPRIFTIHGLSEMHGHTRVFPHCRFGQNQCFVESVRTHNRVFSHWQLCPNSTSEVTPFPKDAGPSSSVCEWPQGKTPIKYNTWDLMK